MKSGFHLIEVVGLVAFTFALRCGTAKGKSLVSVAVRKGCFA